MRLPSISIFRLVLLAGALVPFPAHSLTLLPGSLETTVAAADAICVGVVNGQTSFRPEPGAGIVTRAIVQVEEAIKGTFPGRYRLIQAGGFHEGVHQVDSAFHPLRSGQRYLFLLVRSSAGDLRPLAGPNGVIPATREGYGTQLATVRAAAASQVGPDVRDQAAAIGDLLVGQTTGGLLDNGGTVDPGRFILPDSGEPVPVIVDKRVLPAGLTESQVLGALTNALDAWVAASSFRYKIEGFEEFSADPRNLDFEDGKLRIMLHDFFNVISDTSSTLGSGGFSRVVNPGSGGEVAGRTFNRTRYGYLTMNHPKETLETLSNYEEVLTHELGHCLGLDHSSENQFEADTFLSDAAMFSLVHKDGRGASLRAYDLDRIQLVHPANTPPFGYDRVMRIVTKPEGGTPALPAANQITLVQGDLQGDTLTVEVTQSGNNNGAFSLDATTLTYTCNGFFEGPVGDGDLASQSFDRFTYRFSDGVNKSPSLQVRVVQFLEPVPKLLFLKTAREMGQPGW